MRFHKQIHVYTIMNMDKLTKLTNSIFSFLSSLSQNNNREWFSDNKKDYEKAKSQADSFFRAVYAAIQEKDHLGAIKIYRIYNDLRLPRISHLIRRILVCILVDCSLSIGVVITFI